MAELSNVLDKTVRSVFVGNIPYDVTEEKLKEIFSEVGPVVSFKIVFDRESGKPKGYGFCEYQDMDTAQSAIRNLNAYEIAGRVLRVDSASANDRTKDLAPSFPQLMGPEPIYGENVEPAQAPEAISRAVASLPPEQMFELMKQMKLCIQNNPVEARQMLLQNPQLAYALLQALVVMKVVDPQMALTMLQRANTQPPVLLPSEGPGPSGPRGMPMVGPGPSGIRPAGLLPGLGQGPGPMGPGPMGPPAPQFGARPPMGGDGPWSGPQRMPMPGPSMPPAQDMDFRNIPRDMDMRGQPGRGGPPVGPSGDVDTRFGRDNRPMPPGAPPAARDPRAAAAAARAGPVPQPVAPPLPNLGVPAGTDQEKTALIMQVLQLSDEQIALLPPEQRQSIMVLKEQIARSAPR